MKNRASKLLESRDLQLYRRMLRVLGDYSVNVPATGVDALFNVAVEKGAQILPKDKDAINILKSVFSGESSAATVHKMLNLRFSDLPMDVRPMIKGVRGHVVASWSRNGNVSDRIKDLVDWAASGQKGMWTNIDGEKVEVVTSGEEETV